MLSPSAQAKWHQASSKHFVVYSDDNPTALREFTAKLERFDKAISVWHMMPEKDRGPASRVSIYMVDNVAEVQRIYGRTGPAGFYIPRGAGSIAIMPRNGGDGDLSAQAILFHEYTHHWMFSNWSDAAFPYWFVEGFAELHATAIMKPDGSVVFGAQPVYRRWTVARGNLMPAAELLQVFPSANLTDASRDAVYSRGWLLMHYLTFDPTRRKQLAEYITAINNGKTLAEASKVFGNLNTLDLKMDGWLNRSQGPAVTLTENQLPTGDIAIRELSPGEAAIMPALIRSRRGVDNKLAPSVLALARRLAKPFPDDAAAQNELAEAEFDAASVLNDDNEAIAGFRRAEAAADRAIAVDPKSVHALLYKGMALEKIALRSKTSDPARWEEVRKWFLAANHVDTEDPEPLSQFYDSFILAKEKPTRNAEAAMIYAYMLAPYGADLRIKATRVFLSQGKLSDARVAIGPIAFSAEAPGLAERGQKILAAIDSNDVAGALKLLNQKSDDDNGDGKDDVSTRRSGHR